MQVASEPSRAPKRARAKHGPAILAELVAGASLEQIAQTRKMTAKRAEKLLRDELQRRWVAPAQDYARLQIARLESMSAKLTGKAEEGDLPSIDRLLRILDRLDKYHGFSKLTPAVAEYDEDARQKLLDKLDKAAARMLSAPATPT